MQPLLRKHRQLAFLQRSPSWLRGTWSPLRQTPPHPILSRSCQCQQYVSAEELCDAQCLARAPQLSLAWGPSRELILNMKDEAGDSVQRVSPARGEAGRDGQPLPTRDRRDGPPAPVATEPPAPV